MTTKAWHIHPRANDELDAASARYERKRVGLAADFLDAFAATRAALLHTPMIGTAQQVGRYTVRQALLDGFPHAIVFAEIADGYLIVAVAHVRRRPRYWRGRLRGSAPR